MFSKASLVQKNKIRIYDLRVEVRQNQYIKLIIQMYSKLLFSLLLISVAIGLDLKAQYCQLKANTTGEIVIGASENLTGRTATEILLRTQTIISNGATVTLAYIQKEGSLLIEEQGKDLTTKVHTESSANTLVYIDSQNQYVLAKEITDLKTGAFNYVLLKATLGSNGIMTIFTISSSIDASSNDISGLSLKKILDLMDKNLYVLLSGTGKTSIYMVNTTTQTNLALYADVTTTKTLNIVDGNVQYLYDSSSTIYALTLLAGVKTYTAITQKDLGLPVMINTNSLMFVHLETTLLVVFSYDGQNTTNILPIPINSNVSAASIISINGTASIYTDNYKNLIAVSPADLAWIRIGSTGLESVKLSAIAQASLNATEKKHILTQINLAGFVSFDNQSAVIISHEPSLIKGSLFSLTFDSTATNILTVPDQYIETIDLEATGYSNILDPSSVTAYQSEFSCDCVTTGIQNLDCYSAAFKCIAISQSKRETCAKTP